MNAALDDTSDLPVLTLPVRYEDVVHQLAQSGVRTEDDVRKRLAERPEWILASIRQDPSIRVAAVQVLTDEVMERAIQYQTGTEVFRLMERVALNLAARNLLSSIHYYRDWLEESGPAAGCTP